MSKLKASDLQIAGITTSSVTKAFSMAHQMGLAKVTLGSKSVPTIQYYTVSGTNTETIGTTEGTTTVTASSTFTGNTMFVSGTTCYAVLPKSTNRAFKGTGLDVWTETYTANADAGKCCTYTAASKRTFIKKGWIYEYADNNMYSLAITQAGSYKLEVWGAQGGDSFGYVSDTGANSEVNQHAGGLGGYSYGNCSGIAGNKLYIVVGGSGMKLGHKAYDDPNTTTTENGKGYNGGATPSTLWDFYGDHYNGGGGGATHIATTSGLLETLSDKKSQILIVAGGGGGSGWYRCNVNKYGTNGPGYHYGWGGTGGGSAGGNSSHIYSDNSWPHPTSGTGGHNPSSGLGGNSSGNTASFGKGVSGANGCGGGGYFGGGASTGGGGGSGYIGGVSGGSTSNGVREGHGYARITTNFEWSFE